MEYADGGTLEKRIKEKARDKRFYSNEELFATFSQLIEGMKAINQILIHRDIKPDNILIHKNNFKISDFGLSKIVTQATRTSTFKGIGCLPYLSPEGWKLDKNTIQMDIYSMGIVFYEIASLSFPYKVTKGDLDEWKNIHLFQAPENVGKINQNLSPVLSHLIMKMLEKDTVRRPKNWDEIESLLKKDKLPLTENAEIINSILSKRNEKEQKATKEKLEKEKRQNEIIEFKNLILYQYHKEIILPIKNFIDDINSKSDGSKVSFHVDRNSFLNTIEYSNYIIRIELKPIIDEDFYREVEINDFGQVITRRELRIPKIQNRIVLAWGFIKANDKRGFNILLMEKPESIYGNWLLLFNKHSVVALPRDNRPEPFPFEFSEIEKEISYLGAMHIYVTTKTDLDLNIIKKFLSNYF
jgi:serine/threonine protein kinase